jgi:hypothetical protein
MTETQYKSLADEIRADYQIPPYLSDETLIRSIKTCESRLSRLKPNADFESDKFARSLLSNAVYYDIHHNSDEFMKNYREDVMTWQLSEVVEDDETQNEPGA